jgi:hypothetical protein
MSQHYSDPTRADEQYALPDIETWHDQIAESVCCNIDVPRSYADACDRQPCPSCNLEAIWQTTPRSGWFYWSCFPGCLPDSDPAGPYASEQMAIDAARQS